MWKCLRPSKKAKASKLRPFPMPCLCLGQDENRDVHKLRQQLNERLKETDVICVRMTSFEPCPKPKQPKIMWYLEFGPRRQMPIKDIRHVVEAVGGKVECKFDEGICVKVSCKTIHSHRNRPPSPDRN